MGKQRKRKSKKKKQDNSRDNSAVSSAVPSSIDSNSPNRAHPMEGSAKRKHEGNPNDFPNKLAGKKPIVLDLNHEQTETILPPPSTPVTDFDFVGDDKTEFFNNKPPLSDLRTDSKFLEVEVEPIVEEFVSDLIEEVCLENTVAFDEEELEQPSFHEEDEEECPDPDEIAIEISPCTQEASTKEDESGFLKTFPKKLWNVVPTKITNTITTFTPKTITNLFTHPSTTQKFTYIPSNSPQPHHSEIPIVFRIAAASIILYMMWPLFAIGSVTGVYLTPQAIRAKLVGVLNSFGLERFVPSLGPVTDDEGVFVGEVV